MMHLTFSNVVLAIAALLLMVKYRIMPLGMQVNLDDPASLEEVSDDVLSGEKARPDGADTPPAQPDPTGGNPDAGTASGAAAATGGEGGEGKKPDTPAQGAADGGKPAGEPAAPAAGAAAGCEQLLAGRFKTREDLAKGILEIAKPLKYSIEVLQTALEMAKETGNWAAVEKMYVALNKALSAGEKAGDAPGAAKGPASPENLDPATQKQAAETVQVYALQETRSAVMNSQLMQELVAAGYKVPKGFLVDEKATDTFLDQLRKDGMAIEWLQLTQLMKGSYAHFEKEAQTYLQAEAAAPGHNKAQRDAALQSIRDFAQKTGMTVKDEDLQAFLAEAEKDPLAVEMRSEVPYLRSEGILNAWRLRNFDAIMKHVDLAGEVRGRTQAAADLAGLDAKGKRAASPSTSGLPSTHQEAPKVNLDNPDEVESMDEAALFGTPKK